MQRKHRLLQWTCLGIAALSMLAGAPAYADKTKTLSKKPRIAAKQTAMLDAKAIAALEARQDQQMRTVFSLVQANDKRLQSVLERMPASKSMRSELKKIGNAKNPRSRQKMISSYQKKYRDIYGKALAQAKVNPKTLVSRARRAAPDLVIQLDGSYGLKAKRRVSGLSQAEAANVVQPLTVTTRLTNFLRDQDVTTAAGAGGRVRFTSTSVHAFALAAVAGGVGAEGRLFKAVEFPADAQNRRFSARGTVHTDALAIGVLGAASTSCRATAFNLTGRFATAETFIVAPLLWVMTDYVETDFDSVRLARESGEDKFEARVDCFALAGLSPETHGNASVSNLAVDLIYER